MSRYSIQEYSTRWLRYPLDGKDVLGLSPGGLRAVRWTSGAIIFQGALHALNPVQTVGDQIAEGLVLHRELDAERARLGIDDSLLRLSVGLEAAADLVADLKHALAR